MKSRIKIITLGVSDLERSLTFYRDGLGLPTKGIIGQEFEDGAVVFFHMNDDLILALYPTASLSKDAKITATQSRLGAVSIGHIVKSKEHKADENLGHSPPVQFTPRPEASPPASGARRRGASSPLPLPRQRSG
jgi:catechol 2,3-dioxygenase-like lactoylglutathione lyase family enzyme